MRRLNLGFFWFILLAILSAAGASGSVLKDPGVPDGEQIVWQATREGKKLTRTTITWHVKNRNGRQVYEITQDSGGRKHAKFVIDKSDLRLIEAEVLRDKEEGKSRIAIEVRNGKQYLSYTEGNKKPKTKDIDQEPNGYNGLVLPHCLRGFPFNTREKVEIELTPPFRPGLPFWAWKMWRSHAKFVGAEKVTVPAGTFDCYKLEVGASGGLIKRLTSSYYFWFAKDPPYHFVKYQDEDGKNITELMEVKQPVRSEENIPE
jgi:hypothetical protein